jgi:hypothetical protein
MTRVSIRQDKALAAKLGMLWKFQRSRYSHEESRITRTVHKKKPKKKKKHKLAKDNGLQTTDCNNSVKKKLPKPNNDRRPFNEISKKNNAADIHHSHVIRGRLMLECRPGAALLSTPTALIPFLGVIGPVCILSVAPATDPGGRELVPVPSGRKFGSAFGHDCFGRHFLAGGR